MKYVVVGKHDLTGLQRALLEMAGYDVEAGRIERLGVEEAIELAKREGASLFVQGVPMPLLARLFERAEQEGIEVLGVEKKLYGIIPCEAIEALAPDADIVIPLRDGINCKAQKTKGIVRYTNVAYEYEWLVRD